MIIERTLQHPVPAVRAFIVNSQGRVLILRRANTRFGEGDWCLPGGKIDYGQTVEGALTAEIQEELSLQVVQAEFLFFQDSLPFETGAPHYLNLYFSCTTRGQIALNDESSFFAWVGISDLDEYNIVFRNDAAIRRYFTEHSLNAKSH